MTNSKKSTNELNPTLARVTKLLNEAKFNPRVPGILNVIVNAGTPEYFEIRAMEFISEASITRGTDTDEPYTAFKQYKDELISAIRMLTIAVLKVEDGEA